MEKGKKDQELFTSVFNTNYFSSNAVTMSFTLEKLLFTVFLKMKPKKYIK